MANWGEMNLERLRAKLEALKSAREGSVSRGLQMGQSLGQLGETIKGGFGDLAQQFRELGKEKRGYQQEKDILKQQGTQAESLEGLRQSGAISLEEKQAGARQYEQSVGQRHEAAERAKDRLSREEQDRLDRENAIAVANIRIREVEPQDLMSVYEKAKNSVWEMHPEMWETGVFALVIKDEKTAGQLKKEFQRELAIAGLPPEAGQKLQDAFDLYIDNALGVIKEPLVEDGGKGSHPEIDQFLSQYKSTTLRKRSGAWAKDFIEGLRELDKATPSVDLTPAISLTKKYGENDAIPQDKLAAILELIQQLAYSGGPTRPSGAEVEEPPPGWDTTIPGGIPFSRGAPSVGAPKAQPSATVPPGFDTKIPGGMVGRASGGTAWIEGLEELENMKKQYAMDMYNVPYEELTEEERQIVDEMAREAWEKK